MDWVGKIDIEMLFLYVGNQCVVASCLWATKTEGSSVIAIITPATITVSRNPSRIGSAYKHDSLIS